MPTHPDTFHARAHLPVGGSQFDFFSLAALARRFPRVARLPFSLKVLLENLLRHEDGRVVTARHVEALANWEPAAVPDTEISFTVARVLLQDFTGVPAVVDLAAMREALAAMGGDPARINPLRPADLVIDHSVMVDHFGTASAFDQNVEREYGRNRERYQFLRWGAQSLRNFRVVPPGTGICHQVNLEHLAHVVFREPSGLVYPDTLVGTDSHTTMVNALGVVGWGVGGIEAEASLLGQPVTLLIPQVVGVRLTGALPAGATATDAVLTVTELLRKKGVVGKFVEFYGPGVSALSLPDRATLSNMAPEYGATVGVFPVDAETLVYLRFTGRPEGQVALVEAYCRAQGLWHDAQSPEPVFSDTVELDLGHVVPSLAGPKRPQDRVPLVEAKAAVRKSLAPLKELRHGKPVTVAYGQGQYELDHAAVVIAAITSCTNTSNPSVLLGAGLLAKKAVERGLATRPWVKTSLAPGSQVVTDYLREAGLTPFLEALGFHLVGYGCTTCIGNSGPLPPPVSGAVTQGELVVAAVLSGNRNFEGRISPQVQMNFLASPPLVVAYALAGSMDVDLATEPLGHDKRGKPVFLGDIWPTQEELREAMKAVRPEQFRARYAHVWEGDARWQALPSGDGSGTANWDPASTYVRRPPFFDDIPPVPRPLSDVRGARVLALLGDSITTDHISPAGDISKKGPAADYLRAHGVPDAEFNSYGARRGNHEVMVRGTFANTRLRNLLVPGVEGGVTLHDGQQLSIYDAATRYQAAGVPLVVVAGAEYGTGSSRDWAAKGTALLGVRAVLAKSFERIHRSNLVGMGVLPLQFAEGEDAQSLGLTGHESFDITGVAEGLAPGKQLQVQAGEKRFTVTCRIDTPNELDYFRHGGILHFVLRQLAKG
ncbi:MAG: hypothetical protein RL653_3484 [Pseudomonadota bacterium]